MKDTTLMMAYYYSESNYVKDTATVNSKGELLFNGKEPLTQGVYFLVSTGKSNIMLFQFVVGSDQQFRIETSKDDYVTNVKVTGDLDNKLFTENKNFETAKYKEAEQFIKILQDSTLKEDAKKDAREKFTAIRQKVMDYQADIIAKYPTTMTARMLNAAQPIKVPDAPKRADGTIDSTFQLKWYRQHFFDNFNLADDALIRLPQPIYSQKIGEYLDKLFIPEADTLIKAIDWLVARAKKNKETYKYMVYQCLLKYQDPKIMGLEKIFVHIHDKYFASGEMNFWANDKYKQNLKEYADKLRPSLVGMKGQNLIMQDTTLALRALYDIKNKYTFVFFYNPDCGHCKEETPKLVSFYDSRRTKFNVDVYAVCMDSSLVKMKKFIKEFKMKWINVNGPRSAVGDYSKLYDVSTTPMLYILDEKKKIIAKKIPIEKIEEFLFNYEKMILKRNSHL
jgi:thiol-disulfide isomerase/thioredoxin